MMIKITKFVQKVFIYFEELSQHHPIQNCFALRPRTVEEAFAPVYGVSSLVGLHYH